MEHFLDYVRKEGPFTPYQIRTIEYFFRCVISEISKLAIMLLIYLIVGISGRLVWVLCFLLPIRCFTGGIHMKHYWSCFGLTFGIILLSSIILPGYVPLYFNLHSCILMLMVCLFIMLAIGPVPSSNRPFPKEAVIVKSKKFTFILMVAAMVVIAFYWNHAIAAIGFWTIMLQTLQLIIGKIIILQKGEPK